MTSLSRREFLERLALAGSAAMLTTPRLFGQERGQQLEKPEPTADACILVWMAGGMAAAETFDPKRYVPFEVGRRLDDVMSTFPAIDTALDGVQICQGLEEIAKILDRGTLIRTLQLPDIGHILHSRHQYHWHTGYVPPLTVAAPHLGSWIARMRGPVDPAMPAFVDIGQRLAGIGEVEELKAFHTAGFLGSEYGPFVLPHPDQAIQAVRPPRGMTPERFRQRYRQLRELLKAGPDASAYQQESRLKAMEAAFRLLDSPKRVAFDLAEEPEKTAAPYGNTRFGRGCLLARRLVENGVRFVEVTTEYVPFYHWDTHENGHTTTKRMHREIDRPFAQLIRDLDERGLLDRTLVILATEFSRDTMIEGVPGSSARDQSLARTDVLQEMKQYGQHRHFTGACSALLFGGGAKRGHVFGDTAPERPCLPTGEAISLTDLHATIYHALGIPADTAFEVEGRPFYVTKDGKGKPQRSLL